MTESVVDPCRGEVWIIRFDPSIGDEIQKERPAVVVGLDGINRLRLRIIVPLTKWKPDYSMHVWKIHVLPRDENGLSAESAADCVQVKSLSVNRFVRKLGFLTTNELEDIAAAVALCVGYNP